MEGNRSFAMADLMEVRAEIDHARAELAELYRRRTQAAADALEAGLTKQEIAELLDVVRPAVNKILAGQDGLPARQGWRGGGDAIERP